MTTISLLFFLSFAILHFLYFKSLDFQSFPNPITAKTHFNLSFLFASVIAYLSLHPNQYGSVALFYAVAIFVNSFADFGASLHKDSYSWLHFCGKKYPKPFVLTKVILAAILIQVSTHVLILGNDKVFLNDGICSMFQDTKHASSFALLYLITGICIFICVIVKCIKNQNKKDI